MRILEELWYGNITTQDRNIPPNSQISKLIRLIARNEEKLVSLLSDEAKIEFEKMKDNHAKVLRRHAVLHLACSNASFAAGAEFIVYKQTFSGISHLSCPSFKP